MMRRTFLLVALLGLMAFYLWAGVRDLIVSFDRSGREHLRYLFGSVAWIGVGGCAALVTLLQVLTRGSDDAPVIRETAIMEGTIPAFVFRTSPGRKPLLWIGCFTLVLTAPMLVALGWGHTTRPNWYQFINSLLYFCALVLLLRDGFFPTSRLALTERGLAYASRGSGSGLIPWDSIQSARLVSRVYVPFLEVRLARPAVVESAGSWTKRVASGKGIILISMLRFRSSPRVVDAAVSRFLERPEERPKVGTEEGLRLLSQPT